MRATRSSARCSKACATRSAGTPIIEGGNIIGLSRTDGANVSLEPGGQFELSGAPLRTIHQTCDEVNAHLREVREVADPIGIGFLGLGAAPKWTLAETPLMPKGRYEIMTRYMAEVGTHGLDMMYRTCTIQVNLDFASEADMVQKMRVALALQPVATALFANSPFTEGKPNGHKSWRADIWRDTDTARTGLLPFVFEDGIRLRALCRLRARRADVLRLPRRPLHRRARPVLPRLHDGRAAGAAGRDPDAVATGPTI